MGSATQPRFITLEGGEGAGKSTQLKLLAASFAAAGMSAITTREPGGAAGGEAIRALVVSGDADKWDAKTETLLFMAARLDHVEKLIKPALKKGQWVLCDRFNDSTVVYQGIAGGVGKDWVINMYRYIFGDFAPQLTLLLDIDNKIGLSRTEKRGTKGESRFEEKTTGAFAGYHLVVENAFKVLAHDYPERIVKIDAAQSSAQVHEAVVAALNKRFGLALKPATGA